MFLQASHGSVFSTIIFSYFKLFSTTRSDEGTFADDCRVLISMHNSENEAIRTSKLDNAQAWKVTFVPHKRQKMTTLHQTWSNQFDIE